MEGGMLNVGRKNKIIAISSCSSLHLFLIGCDRVRG